MRKRLDVKPTSANNDRQLASRMNLINRPRGDAPKFFGAHLFVKRYHADQMMECFRERCSIRLRRQQIESVINLKRIRADNLRADLLWDVGSELGFYGPGRLVDNNKGFHKIKLLEMR